MSAPIRKLSELPQAAGCSLTPWCLCGATPCPGHPLIRAHALVLYARQSNYDAIRLRRDRGRWADEQRNTAIRHRNQLMAQARDLAALARVQGGAR